MKSAKLHTQNMYLKKIKFKIISVLRVHVQSHQYHISPKGDEGQSLIEPEVSIITYSYPKFKARQSTKKFMLCSGMQNVCSSVDFIHNGQGVDAVLDTFKNLDLR